MKNEVRPGAKRVGQIVEAFIRAGWNPPRPTTRGTLNILDDMDRLGAKVSSKTYDLDAVARPNLPTLILNPSELRTMKALADGCTYAEGAKAIGVQVETFRRYARDARRKLGAKNTAHATALLFRAGLID